VSLKLDSEIQTDSNASSQYSRTGTVKRFTVKSVHPASCALLGFTFAICIYTSHPEQIPQAFLDLSFFRLSSMRSLVAALILSQLSSFSLAASFDSKRTTDAAPLWILPAGAVVHKCFTAVSNVVGAPIQIQDCNSSAGKCLSFTPSPPFLKRPSCFARSRIRSFRRRSYGFRQMCFRVQYKCRNSSSISNVLTQCGLSKVHHHPLYYCFDWYGRVC
jgi:hypothetical protein